MKKTVFIFSLIVGFIFTIGSIIPPDDTDDFELIKNLEIYHNIFRELRMYYVDKINVRELITYSIEAMLAQLDPYTNYFSENQIEQSRFLEQGRYSGIGITVDTFENNIIITKIIDNAPAQKAGLMLGDIILEIDGKKIEGDLDKMQEMILGAINTSMKMTILRNNKQITKTVKREIIKAPTVVYTTVLDGYGYIAFKNFSINSANDFKKEFMKLRKSDIKGLIIDLRNNPGGLLIQAVSIANFFIPKNVLVVSSKGKSIDTVFYTKNQPIDTEIPLVILVNENSASASEILSGTMQDYDRAVIIGRRTYGKGLVQNIVDVGYNSKLKLTISRYYIPSGRCIQAIDYSKHKNYKNTPDSLLKKFKTSNGRIVYESKGIEPDIKVSENSRPEVIEQMKKQKVFLRFAADYYYKHPDTETNVENFSFDNQKAFADFLEKINFEYIPKNIRFLDSAINSTNDSLIRGKIRNIKNEITTSNEAITKKYFEIIKVETEKILIEMYFGEKGLMKYSLKNSPYLDSALTVLKNRNRYNSILNP